MQNVPASPVVTAQSATDSVDSPRWKMLRPAALSAIVRPCDRWKMLKTAGLTGLAWCPWAGLVPLGWPGAPAAPQLAHQG